MNDEFQYTPNVPKPERDLTPEELDSKFSGDLNDIMKEIIEVDDTGASRSVVLFTIEEYTNYFLVNNFEDLTSKVKRQIEINFPIVDIFPTSAEYTMISLKFMSDVSADMRGVWEGLNYYKEAMENMNNKLKNNDNTASAPILTLTFMPKKYNGDYYVIASSPIFWALAGDTIGEKVKEIRMLFKCDDVCIMKSEFTEAEKQELNSEVQRENALHNEWIEECYRKDNEIEE